MVTGVALLLGWMCSGPGYAAQPDVAGSRDHPLVSRYPGASITDYHVTEHGEYAVMSALPRAGKASFLQAEGKITTIHYRLPASASTLQVMRNYEKAFKDGGFAPLAACAAEKCPSDLTTQIFERQSGRTMDYSGFGIHLDTSDYRFWVGEMRKGNAKIYVSLHVKKVGATEAQAVLDVVEPRPMQTGLVKLDVGAIDAALKGQGRVVLDGILFDHDKATIKPESSASLKAIADYLKANAKVSAFVVGHTDTSGDYKRNLALSQQRADAVVRALVNDYRIASARLLPVGIGPVAPAASNAADGGRSQNRRVEMVLR
jgi:outer membrane protein OmpA-like peptidoglycan-associated protein